MVPFVVEYPGTNTFFTSHFGENAEDYSSKLSQSYNASLSGLKLFSGEVSGSFANTNSYSSKYAYAGVSMLITQRHLRVFLTPAELRAAYLTDKFKSDVNALSIAELVGRYGTHVLSDITLGARFDLNYRAQTNSAKRTEAVKAGATVKGLFGIFGISANIDKDESLATSNFDQTVSYQTVGGDATKGLIGEISLDNTNIPKLSIGTWQGGCSINNATLVQIGENGLIPLWELIEDPAKSSAVQSYIRQYLIDRQISLTYEKIDVYEYFSLQGTDHFFTTDRSLDGNSYWSFSGAKFKALNSPAPGAVPAYSYYSSYGTDHVILLDRTPALQNPSYWNVGGSIAFYVYTTQQAGTIPVYAYYHDYDRSHILAADADLINYLNNNSGWRNDGVLFYAYPVK
ncbi:hypothetical protein H7F33_11320 [Pedobacter sp. PAMC26386]|nr:hypothetical protein H7F33_11320 [Pedobacter sp. PAMC26386]